MVIECWMYSLICKLNTVLFYIYFKTIYMWCQYYDFSKSVKAKSIYLYIKEEVCAFKRIISWP